MIDILLRNYSIVGFWVVTEYIKGTCVVYELIIEEWYVNPLKLKMAQHCLPINKFTIITLIYQHFYVYFILQQ